MSGIHQLDQAEWLIGFDFDGTLADPTQGHSVSELFFQTLELAKQHAPLAWGICTGRSLEFLLEGMEKAQFPFWPDFIVTQERDLFYLNARGDQYEPDEERNSTAEKELKALLAENSATLDKAQSYIENNTEGQWVSIAGDPAGIIATHESEIGEVVKIYQACDQKTSNLEYQRNTIYLRFSHKDYCKGTALQYLQRTYMLSHSRTLVMGDNYNDLTMLNSDIAKYFGGPQNSIITLKEVLNANGGFITQANYAHGVTEAIQRIILGRVDN